MNKVQFKSAEAAAVVTVDRTAAAAARKLYYTAVAVAVRVRSGLRILAFHCLFVRVRTRTDPLPRLVASVLGGGGGGSTGIG